jgi:hypothetical protein
MNSSSPFRDAVFLHLRDALGAQWQPGPGAGLVHIRVTQPVLIERLPWWKLAQQNAWSLRDQLEFQCGFDDLGRPMLHQYKRVWIIELEVSRFGLYYVTRGVFDLS